MKVSFAIISWNIEKTIGDCLKSINALEIGDKEVFIIDDNSSDRTVSIAQQYTNDIIVKNHNDKGISTSRNIAINHATGDLLFIIDGDIEIKSLPLEEIIDFFHKDEKLIALCGNYYANNTNTHEMNFNVALDIRREYISLKRNISYIYDYNKFTTFSGGFSCINLRRLETLPEFLVNLKSSAEDLLWQVNLIQMGYKFAYISNFEGIHLHRRNGRGMMKKAKTEAKGLYWTFEQTLCNKGMPPIVEQALYFPLFPLIAVLLLPFNLYLSATFMLLEFFPYLVILIIERKFPLNAKMDLIYYTLIKIGLQYIELPFFFLSSTVPIKTKLKLILFALYSDVIAKINWISGTIFYYAHT